MGKFILSGNNGEEWLNTDNVLMNWRPASVMVCISIYLYVCEWLMVGRGNGGPNGHSNIGYEYNCRHKDS